MARENTRGERAKDMYDYLRARLNQPVRYRDLFKAMELKDNAANRGAMRLVRDLAAQDGLCCPVPCQANGFSIAVTDDPVAALDPALWLSRMEQGVAVTKQVHQDFMKSRLAAMDKDNRSITKAWLDFDDKVRAVNAGAANLTKAMIEMRRKGRGDQ